MGVGTSAYAYRFFFSLNGLVGVLDIGIWFCSFGLIPLDDGSRSVVSRDEGL